MGVVESAVVYDPGPDDVALPPEMARAPLYAQMLWVAQRRQEQRQNALEATLAHALSGVEKAVIGSAKVAADGYDELRKMIGAPGDEHGLGAHGVAGEVGAVKRLIGTEPVEGIHPGSGILGRLARHDQSRTWWDNRAREAKGAAFVIAGSAAAVWFLIGDKVKDLFAAKTGGG